MKKISNSSLKVINIGIPWFCDGIKDKGGNVMQVDWSPSPFNVSEKDSLVLKNHESIINKANQKTVDIINSAKPMLIGMGLAKDLLPIFQNKRTILHAGPPITWDRMCGPMRGGVIGAMLYEGWAKSAKEAEFIAAKGDVYFAPAHEHQAVGPMAGIISPSMPMFIVENEMYGNRAYCTMNEGLGKVLRYGAYSEDVIVRLKWMEQTLYPVLSKAINIVNKVCLKTLISQALHMGDEVHNRNRAGTSLLYRQLAPAFVKSGFSLDQIAQSLEFINGNDHFFLNLSMAASKASLDAARNIPNSSIVVVMARNGTDFGVQLSGMGDQWFVGEALVPDALYFAGYSKKDANRDIGDSAITETLGLGGFSMAASPAIVKFVGGSAQDALNYTNEMYEICESESTHYQIPSLDFRGSPTGIDVRKVIETGILPVIDTGVAHKEPGIGQVGAGCLRAPTDPFEKAYIAFAHKLSK